MIQSLKIQGLPHRGLREGQGRPEGRAEFAELPETPGQPNARLVFFLDAPCCQGFVKTVTLLMSLSCFSSFHRLRIG